MFKLKEMNLIKEKSEMESEYYMMFLFYFVFFFSNVISGYFNF